MRNSQIRWAIGTWAAAAMLLNCGCNKTEPTTARVDRAGARAPALPLPAAPTAVTAAALPSDPTPTRAEVDGLIQSWLTAQNQGDFPAYERLYADRMTGVRRTGTIVKRLDRANWMAERKRMFVKAMRVEASDVNVTASGGLALVQFTQRFATGSFADEGPKMWTIVRQRGALKIAREEMLASRLLDGQAPVERPEATLLALAYVTERDTWLVVGPPQGATPTAAPELVSRDRPAAARRAVPLAKDSPWRDRDVVLLGPAGEQCRGQVDGAGWLARINPHFGQVQTWRGEEGHKPMPDAEVAAEIWDQGRAAATQAVHIRVYQGDCKGAVWGRASNLAPATVLARATMREGQLYASAMQAVRALPAYQRVQREYAERVPAPRDLYWDQYDGAKAEVVSFSGVGRRLVLVHVRAGEFCGGFGGDQMYAFSVAGTVESPGPLQLISDERSGELQWPTAAADVDGDGDFELIGPTQVWKRSGATWRPVWTVDVPDLDCPC